MQSTVIAGDTLDFSIPVADYPPDVWTLKYRLIPVSTAGSVIEFDASADGDEHRVQVGPLTTELWTAGVYNWTAWVTPIATPDTERYTVDSGVCTIKADPRQMAAGTDTRSTARKMVAQLEAALLTYQASNGTIQEYEIAGRRMRYRDGGDLLTDLNYWKGQVANEDALEHIRQKGVDPRRLGVRFGRAY